MCGDPYATVLLNVHKIALPFKGLRSVRLCFWKKYFMLTKAAFIWLKIQIHPCWIKLTPNFWIVA